MTGPRKILILRLSSIGDVVLTSPIIRSLARCHPNAELHFLTKAAYAPLLDHHPQLTRVHRFSGQLEATIRALDAEGFDFVVDLHRNLRTARIKLGLGLPSATYSKDRWAVLWHTKTGWGKLPETHTVERYARTLSALDCALDAQGLELFLAPEARKLARDMRTRYFRQRPFGVVLGGGFATKRWPAAYFVELLNGLDEPVVLFGGPEDRDVAEAVTAGLQFEPFNTVGEYALELSAALVGECRLLLTHDTGLMHVAAASGVPTVSLWGNTVPEFGFAPYRADNVSLQVEGLNCRPCSKLGHAACPKGHFRCMRDLRPERVAAVLRAHPAWDPTKTPSPGGEGV